MHEKFITPELISQIYKPRPKSTHKGNFGHALIVGGNVGKMGAAVISAQSCLRTGAGLTTVCCHPAFFPIIHIACPEAMCIERETPIATGKYSALLIGPALGMTGVEFSILSQILNDGTASLVLDADALTLIAAHPELKSRIPKGSVITPHLKEFDRVFGRHASTEERIVTAQKFSRERELVVVLKDFETTIIEGDTVYYNTLTGNQGLAKGGSGDALAGMIVSLLAQGYKSLEAATLGVYLHGLAADITCHTQSHESMTITDVIENLGAAFKSIGRDP